MVTFFIDAHGVQVLTTEMKFAGGMLVYPIRGKQVHFIENTFMIEGKISPVAKNQKRVSY